MRKMIAAAVAASMFAPSVALASRPSGFPRFFEKDGQTCVQMLNSDNTITETCRPAEAPGAQLKRVELGASSPWRGGWSNDPMATGRRHAQGDTDSSRFGTGLGLGLLLGLVGTVIAGVAVGSSAVDVPPPHPEYTDGQAFAYQKAYADEVRSSRVGSAIAGGLVGTAITVGVVLLVVSQSNNSR